MAFMTGYLEGYYEINSVRSNFSWRDTCIFAKRDGKWVRIHFHTSQLAVGNGGFNFEVHNIFSRFSGLKDLLWG